MLDKMIKKMLRSLQQDQNELGYMEAKSGITP